MIHWRRGRVVGVIRERQGLQEVVVTTDDGEGRATVLTALTGSVTPGDEVLLNVTAVHLGLGSGGKHFVIAAPDRLPADPGGPGHLMKLRYTPIQLRCPTVEETADTPPELGGQLVLVGELHSQLLPAVLALRSILGRAVRLAYIMTDGGALPLALSDTVAELRTRGLLDGTVTIGHAFGGDYEALNIYSGLLVARHTLQADLSLVMMGPGVAGSASRFGHTGVEQAINADAAAILGGRAVIIPRISFADRRDRHYGLSHHTLTVCGRLTQRRAILPLPALPGWQLDRIFSRLAEEQIHERHDLQLVQAESTLDLLAESGLVARTMGRGPGDDPAFFLAAGAAGICAARLLLAIRSGC